MAKSTQDVFDQVRDFGPTFASQGLNDLWEQAVADYTAVSDAELETELRGCSVEDFQIFRRTALMMLVTTESAKFPRGTAAYQARLTPKTS